MNSMSGYNPTGSFARGRSTGSLAGGRSSGDVIPKGYRSGQLQQFSPEQMQLFKQLFSHAGPESYLSRLSGGDESSFDQMEEPALRQFGALQGGLASRFSGMGSGARRSSGFQNTATQAGSDFASQLASKRQDLQRQAIMDLMGISESLLGQRPQQRILAPKQQKESSGWGGLIGAGLGGTGGFFLGGPAGALAGANLGYNVGSGF